MSSLLHAVRYLTIVPVPWGAHVGPAALGRAAPWFPVVGAGIGLALVGAERVAATLFPPLLAALLTVTAWKLVTGGLHVDGLADCLDGLVGRDPAHRLAIMRDSRIGAFGAVGLILFLSIEVAAIADLAAPVRWRALLVAPVVGRATPALLARWFPPARAEGQGAAFGGEVRGAAVVVALGVSPALAVAVLGLPGLLAAVGALVAALALGWLLAHRLHGITGDVLGAAVEVSELTVLLTVSAWMHLRP